MKKRNLFMSLTLMCGFFCVAFTFDKEGIYWLWTGNKPVAIFLVMATIILGTFWYESSKKLTRKKKDF